MRPLKPAMPLGSPINADSRRYTTTKAASAGHWLDHLTVLLTDQF
jgi:hypothetical protein